MDAQPSRNPADEGDMVGMLRTVLTKFLQNVDDMLPAKVISFDRATNRAQVQPMIMVLTTEDETVQRAPVASVPVFQIGGGGFILNFNLKPGDLGWLKANDRDISLFAQSYNNSAPNTLRKHSFEDGMFFPDVMRGYTIDPEDEENVVLQTLDGTCRIAIWPDRIKLTAPMIDFDTPVMNLTAPSMNFTGVLTVSTDVVIAGRSFNAHVHSGVTTGGSNTGVRV